MGQTFVWNCFNHNATGVRSLEDIIEIISAQLMALGHKAAWDRSNQTVALDSHGINILAENFPNEGSVAVVARMRAQGARFIILATEEPTPRGFNHGVDPDMVRRQRMFPLLRPYIDGILHLVPGDHITRWYSQFAPAAHAELGFAPLSMRLDAPIMADGRQIAEPDHDFGFFGVVTPRRERLLRALSRGGRKVRVVSDFAPRARRDDEMRRAKVVVQIRKHEEMGLVSSSRCCTALSIGRPVIAEAHELCEPWDRVVTFAGDSRRDFVRAAAGALSGWREIHAEQLARFKRVLPPEACIGRALDQIGLGRAGLDALMERAVV